jgi:SNF2 family DNA or RNA helicase
MTPFETVLAHYKFPEKIGETVFEPHPKQIASINQLAPLTTSGHWHGMGTGKTFMATACALYHRIAHGHDILIILPPLLIKQWARWLGMLKPALSITAYRGTPKQREALDLNANVVIVGIQIFKKEYAKFEAAYSNRPFTLILDEAQQMVASVSSDAHKKVFMFAIGHPTMLLTGTPASNPMDGYAMLKFTAPGTYPNLSVFERIHVEEYDFFKKPAKFKELGLLRENLKINSDRILFEDMYDSTQTPLPIPLHYDLEPDHMRLYEKLVAEKVKELEDGGKVDMTAQHKLFHALGQIVVNWGHFAEDPTKVSNAIYMIEEVLEELGSGKLLLFCHYRMTAALLQHHFSKICAGVINGDASHTQREKAKDKFLDDPKARVLILQAKSGGFGLDGLQHVCNTCFFVEPTQQPNVFHQAIARLHRTGQRNRVRVYMGIADGTLQPNAFRQLLRNDATANTVIRNPYDLKQVLLGK